MDRRQPMLRNFLVRCFLLLALFVVGCGGNAPDTPTGPSVSSSSSSPNAPGTAAPADTHTALLDGLEVDPSFIGGQSAKGTVRLTGPAPAGGVTVTLSADSDDVQVPASVTVNEGETSVSFTIASHPVAALTRIVITASLGETVRTAETELRPLPTLTSIDPREATRGETIKVTLTGTQFVPGQTSLTVSGGDVSISDVTVVSRTELTAVFAIRDGATVSDRDVAVQTPDGTTNAVRFTVRARPTAGAGSATFTFTGAPQLFVVPAGVTQITIEAWGGQGGAGWSSAGQAGLGGLGGRVVATIAVTPLEVLQVNVGGAGADGTLVGGGLGGFNGGGKGGDQLLTGGSGGGGGGGSDVRRGAFLLNDRLVIAGGGGGGGGADIDPTFYGGNGGDGGGLSASPGTNGLNAHGLGYGSPGIQGWAGGEGWSHPPSGNGDPGALGQGGNAAAPTVAHPNGGGGGGGGYYGGGGAGVSSAGASGGGGGSSYAEPTATNVTHERGVNAGNGMVIISW